MPKKETRAPRRGVKIINGRYLRISFTFQGVSCVETFKCDEINNKSISSAENLLAEVKNRINTNSFVYADYFPNSKKLRIFGKAKTNEPIKTYINDVVIRAIKRKLATATISTYKCRARILIEKIGEMPIKLIDKTRKQLLSASKQYGAVPISENDTFQIEGVVTCSIRLQ